MALSGYTKLSSSILASTIWRASDQTRLIWITMLALADADGVVEASVPGLADLARVPLPACEEALRALQAPDAYSRTKDHDGRRIEPVDGGWLLLNYRRFRETPDREARREYLRVKKHESRSRVVATTRQGYIYYATSGDRIKIGFSKNPWARISEFKVADPTISLVAVEQGAFDVEAQRHEQFKALHLAGEWFTFTGELIEHVEQIRRSTTVATTSTTSTQAEAEAEARSYTAYTNGGADAPAGQKRTRERRKADRRTTPHRGHVSGYCDWVCLPAKLRDQFVSTSGEDVSTPEARAEVEQRVLGWAARVREKWQGRAIGDTIWAFWTARWRERVGATPAVTPTRHAVVPEAEAPAALTPERAERLRLIRAQVAQGWSVQ